MSYSVHSVGLMEKIQAIAQNVSDIAVKVDQILRNSLLRGKGEEQCQITSLMYYVPGQSWS